MKVSLIAAVANNRVIGKNNELIWHLPSDMRFFKHITKGHHVLMGRRNYDSIPQKYRPLPARKNVVITHQAQFKAPGCDVVNSIEAGLEIARNNGEKEAFIIGGGMIYQLALDRQLIDRMYLTQLDKAYEGDIFFPEWNKKEWKTNVTRRFEADAQHETGFTIFVLDRIAV